jgi:hypothetical protein
MPNTSLMHSQRGSSNSAMCWRVPGAFASLLAHCVDHRDRAQTARRVTSRAASRTLLTRYRAVPPSAAPFLDRMYPLKSEPKCAILPICMSSGRVAPRVGEISNAKSPESRPFTR